MHLIIGSHGIYAHWRATGKLFNLKRFATRTKIFITLIRDLPTDVCDLVIDTAINMHQLMIKLNESGKTFGVQLSLVKTMVMYHLAPTNL